jgi:CRP-like cAMP-binding protein
MSTLRAINATTLPPANRILEALPREEHARLLPLLSPVSFKKGRVLWEAGEEIRHAYFLTGGMVALLSVTYDQETVEIGMIGSEGMAGVAAVLRCEAAPYRVMAQLPTTALRIGVGALRAEFSRGGRLQDLLLRYTHALLTQVAQSTSCHRFHTAEQRLCRWLLTSADRAGRSTLPLTQEFLAQMIGVPRTSVTSAAVRLQGRGLIGYRRGRITLLDRRGLESASCECYRAVTAILECHLAA